MAGPVVDRHLNYSMTFQVPLRQFTSLYVKFDLYGIYNFTQLYVIFLTLRKAVSWALRNFTYLVMSCKFAISCCAIYPAFSLTFVDFAVQFCFRCKFSFHEKPHSSQVWQWRDLPKTIIILHQHISTNGIASFCIGHRWRQMAFFVFVKMGKEPLSRVLREVIGCYW